MWDLDYNFNEDFIKAFLYGDKDLIEYIEEFLIPNVYFKSEKYNRYLMFQICPVDFTTNEEICERTGILGFSINSLEPSFNERNITLICNSDILFKLNYKLNYPISIIELGRQWRQGVSNSILSDNECVSNFISSNIGKQGVSNPIFSPIGRQGVSNSILLNTLLDSSYLIEPNVFMDILINLPIIHEIYVEKLGSLLKHLDLTNLSYKLDSLVISNINSFYLEINKDRLAESYDLCISFLHKYYNHIYISCPCTLNSFLKDKSLVNIKNFTDRLRELNVKIKFLDCVPASGRRVGILKFCYKPYLDGVIFNG